jgi:hypothetical protein
LEEVAGEPSPQVSSSAALNNQRRRETAVIVLVLLVAVVAGVGTGAYFAATRPCESGHHRHRHWRREKTGMW